MLTPEEPVSAGVIQAVAAAKGVDETALEPLYDSVDPDALDTIFPTHVDDRHLEQYLVTFHYSGYEIRITGTGVVSAHTIDGAESGQ